MYPMDNEIKIATLGKILEGQENGEYVLIEAAQAGSKDFLIFVGPTSDPKHGPGGGDYWVEDYESLKKFFKEANWKIEWSNKSIKNSDPS